MLMRLEPQAIEQLAAGLSQGSAVLSATNGKTTTAAMVARILERGGARLVHNRAGANMAGGGAPAPPGGDGDTGPFEGDGVLAGPPRPQGGPRAPLPGHPVPAPPAPPRARP